MEKCIAQVGEGSDAKDTIVEIDYEDDKLKIDLGKDLLVIPSKELERADIEVNKVT